MVEPSVTIAATGGGTLVCAYVGGCAYMWRNWATYRPFLYEVCMMNLNAFVGMAAFTLYALNIGMFGLPLRQIDDVLPAERDDCVDCVGDTAASRRLLYAYVYVSLTRFCIWYSEAAISLRFLAVYPAQKLFYIWLRYATHTVNLLLSIAAFIIVTQGDFPTYELLVMRDERKTHPYVTQLIVVFLVFVGYASIAVSKPYQCPHVCIFSKRGVRSEWRR
jgi:hypothetical protein